MTNHPYYALIATAVTVVALFATADLVVLGWLLTIKASNASDARAKRRRAETEDAAHIATAVAFYAAHSNNEGEWTA